MESVEQSFEGVEQAEQVLGGEPFDEVSGLSGEQKEFSSLGSSSLS
jgi:hypothetical protein